VGADQVCEDWEYEDGGGVTLTERQGEILDFIRESIREKGLPPTRAEIAIRFGFKSPNAAEDHLRALKRKGFITLVPAISRGIRITAP
jgi:repressor LexA